MKGATMTQSILSSKYQLVIPRDIRRRMKLHTGQRMLFLVKGDTITLVPDRPLSQLRGIAKGIHTGELREKKDRAV
jgi:AbrB family looped-hinge helix DNA binding protein